MKAMVYTKYGPPEVIEVKEVEKPTPKDNEVLIKVHATTVTAVDSIFRKGEQFAARLFTGLMKPKTTTLGADLAGEIEAVGKDVTLFKVGQPVFGVPVDLGTHAEYVCLPEEAALVIKPAHITYEEAVALADATLTALPFLRDEGKIQHEHKILINGASGSVARWRYSLPNYSALKCRGMQ